jgi:adenylate cyclase
VLADVVVSEDTIRASGRSYSGTTALKIAIKGREKPLTAYGFASAPEIARRKREDVAVPVPVVAGGEATATAETAQDQGEAPDKG